ncbi:hypothetical protein G3O06_35765 [Burkholderia sp. Ac-20345]|uniref:hypothetical protein n=1 Tax=Burkholderia sp. Ac-20345 TaxID=2703891 RepID=UPI00197C037E|nr:hypothetical protein [Burkholderia sp. Ac-20345]MBN3782854.1 hypothetical protein [Burkholderia sp. Ac-20345]
MCSSYRAISRLEPFVDGFCSYNNGEIDASTEALLIDRAQLPKLAGPELTVLVGGMRVFGANYDGSQYGVFTDEVRVLGNDFFVNLLNMTNLWTPVGNGIELDAQIEKPGR